MATNYHKQYNVQIPAFHACVNYMTPTTLLNYSIPTDIKKYVPVPDKIHNQFVHEAPNAAPKPPQHNLITVKASFLPRLFVGPHKAWVRRGYVKTS